MIIIFSRTKISIRTLECTTTIKTKDGIVVVAMSQPPVRP